MKEQKKSVIKKGKSISKLVEEYLDSLSRKNESKYSTVEKLSGILKNKVPANANWKKEKKTYLKKNMVYKVFADTNVYLDFFLQRGTGWKQIEQLFQLAEQKEIELFTSASNLLNMMYVMANHKLSKTDIVDCASLILQYTSLANPDNFTFKTALASGFKDLEDAVQYFTALRVEGIDYFVTSNLKEYKAASHLKVISPKQFLKIYAKE